MYSTFREPQVAWSYCLTTSWLYRVFYRDVLKIRGASIRTLTVFGTVTLHRRISGWQTRVRFVDMDKLVIPAKLGTNVVDKVINSIYPAGRTTDPHHTPPVLIWMVHKARSAAKKAEDLDTRRKFQEDLALFVTVTWCNDRNKMGAWRVMLKSICETPVLVSTKTAGLLQVATRESFAETHACMTAKCIVPVQSITFFYNNLANLGKGDVHHSKHQEPREAANVPVK